MKERYNHKTETLENESRTEDFKIGHRVFYAMTMVWIFQMLRYIDAIMQRPMVFVAPQQWFGKILHALNFPALFYTALAIIALIVCAYLCIKQHHHVLLKVYLLLVIMALNTLKYSMGFLSHVDHLFMLAHFLMLSCDPRHVNALYVKYFQFGLLFTYSLSGVLKLITLILKLLYSSEFTWLHPKALYYQTSLFHEQTRHPIPDWMQYFLQLDCIPLILIIGTFVIEVAAIIVVWHYRWIKYYLLWLLLFHLFNFVFFEINFVYSAVTVFCFLFPFHFFRIEKRANFQAV